MDAKVHIRRRNIYFSLYNDNNDKKLTFYRNISKVFVISSESVITNSYLKLINMYSSLGVAVSSYHIEYSYPENLQSVDKAVQDILHVLATGDCLVYSYGKSFAPTLLAALYASTGVHVHEAIAKLADISDKSGLTVDAFFIEKYYALQKNNPFTIPFVIDMQWFEQKDKLFEAFAKKNIKIDVGIAFDQKEQAQSNIIKPGASLPAEYKQTEINKPEQSLEKTVPLEIPEQAPLSEKEKRQQAEKEAALKKRQQQKANKQVAAPPLDKPARQGTPAHGGPGDRKKETTSPVPLPVELVSQGPFYTRIRFKLIFIISAIIVFSLSSMIFLASHFFRKYNELMVQENNMKISNVIGSRVQAEIEKATIVASTILASGGSVHGIDIATTDVIFAGMAVMSGNNMVITKSIYNDTLINKFQISRENIKKVLGQSSSMFSQAFFGESKIYNISQIIDSPALAVSMPFEKSNNRINSVLLCYLKLDSLLKAFRSQGVTKAFMVNDKGEIIAHPDSSIVQSGVNFKNLPIVKEMMTKPIDNGQKRYKDEKGNFNLGSFKKIGFGGSGVIATVDEAIAFAEVYRIQQRNIYLMMIVLALAILIVFFFGQTISNPIIRLVQATKKIMQGEYHVDIRASSRDEIGVLTNSFIEMGRGLEEREKMKVAFSKFVNKEIADQVLKGEIHLGGERVEACIFFSDIRSFTAISEKLEPEQVVEFLNDYMTRMVNCVYSTHGVVDKYIGDAIMAVWGAPVSKGNDTENALNAALRMRYELMEFNKGRGSKDKPVIKIGCGINTGPVLAGQIGSEDRMEYTVIGDAVNLASRIEALNKPFGTDILISQDSYKRVKDIFAVEPMNKIKVKGKAEPQQIYAVLGRLDDSSRPQSANELRSLLGTVAKGISQGELDGGEVKYEIIE